MHKSAVRSSHKVNQIANQRYWVWRWIVTDSSVYIAMNKEMPTHDTHTTQGPLKKSTQSPFHLCYTERKEDGLRFGEQTAFGEHTSSSSLMKNSRWNFFTSPGRCSQNKTALLSNFAVGGTTKSSNTLMSSVRRTMIHQDDHSWLVSSDRGVPNHAKTLINSSLTFSRIDGTRTEARATHVGV